MSGLKTAHDNLLKEVGQAAVIVADSGSDVVLTAASNRFQVVTPTANRIFTLPSTGIKAGDAFTFVNKSTYKVSFQSSAAGAVDNITLGKITLMALQDAPTLAAHWMTTEANEEWKSYTPTFNSGVSVGTGGAPLSSWKYRRVGTTCEINGIIRLGSSGGTLGSGTFTFSVPTGSTIDNTATGNTSYALVGVASIYDTGGGNREVYNVSQYSSTSTFYIWGRTDTGSSVDVSQTAPITFASGDELQVNIRVPIAEWSMFN